MATDGQKSRRRRRAGSALDRCVIAAFERRCGTDGFTSAVVDPNVRRFWLRGPRPAARYQTVAVVAVASPRWSSTLRPSWSNSRRKGAKTQLQNPSAAAIRAASTSATGPTNPKNPDDNMTKPGHPGDAEADVPRFSVSRRSRANRVGHERQSGANTVAERLEGLPLCRSEGQMGWLSGECRLDLYFLDPGSLILASRSTIRWSSKMAISLATDGMVVSCSMAVSNGPIFASPLLAGVRRSGQKWPSS